jgi:hypothetical protein
MTEMLWLIGGLILGLLIHKWSQGPKDDTAARSSFFGDEKLQWNHDEPETEPCKCAIFEEDTCPFHQKGHCDGYDLKLNRHDDGNGLEETKGV